MKSTIMVLAALMTLSGCGAKSVLATMDSVNRAAYRSEGPAMLTLFTVISNETGSGAHSALLVNADQRAIFDPAGTFNHPRLPERNDVHFGMSDPAVAFYIDYHARISFHVVRQDIVVTPQVAAMALRAIQNYGPVPKAQCSKSVSSVLRQLPGFQSIPNAWYPKKVMEAFGELPGVVQSITYDNDPDNNTGFTVAHGF